MLIDINLEELNKIINKDLDEDESEEFKFTKLRKQYKEECLKEIKDNKLDTKFIINFLLYYLQF